MGDTFSPVTETATSQWLLPFFSIIRSSVRGSSLGLMEGETVLVAEKSSGSRRAALGSAQQQPESHAMERHFNVTDLQRYSPAVPRARVVRRRRSLGATGFSRVPATPGAAGREARLGRHRDPGRRAEHHRRAGARAPARRGWRSARPRPQHHARLLARPGGERARALQHGGLRTGDLGHQDEDGFLWLIGRQSEIIKSGGHRIGPGEIEAALLRHPDIDECGVCGRPDEELGEAIVAFVVLREGAQPSEDELLRHALGELPRFKLPRELRFVHELPRTPSGKLQRRLLLQDD
jgi:acyl-CoA synthetase (AMP-forming)/AMP-acid ligase II